MLQKGIVKELLINDCKLVVRVPIFETAGSQEVVFTCSIMNQPGLINGYNVDDIVYLDFENNDYEHPVVVGKLYTGVDNNKSKSGFLGDNINISGSSNFSTNFKVGNISYKDLLAVVKQLQQNEISGTSSGHLYQHNIVMMSNDKQDYALFNFINSVSNAMDYSEVREWLYDKGFTGEYDDENHYLKATGRCSVDSFEFDYTLSGVTDLGYCESVVVGVRATSEEDDRIKFLVNLLKEDDESTYEEDYTGMDYFTDTVVKLI